MLNYLKNPLLVYKFQRLCGVEPIDSEISVKEEDINGSKTNTLSCKINQFDGENQNENKPNIDTLNQSLRSNGSISKWLNDHLFQQNGAVEHSGEDYIGNAETKRTNCKITRPAVDILFRFGTELGNEIFFITFLPFWYWNIECYAARRVSIFWAIFMYLGQMTKDHIRLPRPSSPPVFRIDSDIYTEEYGMPSTHTMTGLGIPLAIFLLTSSRYQVNKFDILI